MIGIVFDIKEFSLHDGPGGRVTVFLKGCPLRCRWCHNPEGLVREPQLMYKENLCSHCGLCEIPCRHEECIPFGKCLHICSNGCLSVSGKEYDSKELFDKLISYKSFLESNKGGVTFSGGEPLMQADFLCEMLDMLKNEGIHTAIQTSGYAPEETFKKVLGKTDYVMFDIKLADAELHKFYTGVENELILKNFKHLKNSGREYVIRTPLIPGITDSKENIEKIKRIIGDSKHELLSYNEFAPAKYKMLGMKFSLNE